jgi:hypothetical protein
VRALLLVALGLLVLQTEPPVFPAGHFCVRAEAVKNPATDHPCACREHDDCTKPEDGQGSGPSENTNCKQWCHKEHCACKTPCT